MEEVEALAKDPALDARLLPLEVGLAELTELRAPAESVARLRNGNPAAVIGTAEFGETCWASADGKAVAVGTWQGGQLHPNRVFN